MSMAKRLAALEQRAKAGGGLTVVVVEGGLPDPGPRQAHAGPHTWTQEADEDAGAFRARVEKLAKDAGEKLLVIGGLPD